MPARTSPTLHPPFHPTVHQLSRLALLELTIDYDGICTKKEIKEKQLICILTLKVLVATIDAQWEGMGDVGSARYEPALLSPCPTIRVLSYSN